MSQESGEVTLGEVSRGLSRVEREMQAGFAAIRAEIKGLSFVPAPVYAADMLAYRERIERLEHDLVDEARFRRESEVTLQQRAWQARLSVVMAIVGIPTSVIAALLIAALK